jgi:Protein of unknown function (DUF1264)
MPQLLPGNKWQLSKHIKIKRTSHLKINCICQNSNITAMFVTNMTSNAPLTNKDSPPEEIPGAPVALDTKVLDIGRNLLENFTPLKQIHEHVCGFHMYAHDMTRQVVVHHYCSHPTEELRQCILYDSDQPNARLIGIEYIISDRLFKTLPEDEKIYWHSHRYEVSSGTLIAPGVPSFAENKDMQKLANTYGKTFHMWQVDRGDALPLGPPQLMSALTADGQLDPGLLKERDANYKIDSAKKKEDRVDLEYPKEIDPGADHWMKGNKTWQVDMKQVDIVKEINQPQYRQE